MAQRLINRVELKEECAHYYGGHLCGYVKIPQEHSLYGIDEIEDLDCHGGITYNDHNKVQKVTNALPPHWIGFDCAHSGDIVPSTELFKKRHQSLKCIEKAMRQLKDLYPNCSSMNPIYRNMAYCMKECMSIVDQLIEKGP